LLKPGEARDRLTRGIFNSSDSRFRQGQIEQAFVQAARVAPIEKTLREARRAGLLRAKSFAQQLEEALSEGIITQAEATELNKMQALRREVVMVDSFAQYGKQYALTTRRSKKPAIYAV
jgi:acyl-CoA dehydrogenase